MNKSSLSPLTPLTLNEYEKTYEFWENITNYDKEIVSVFVKKKKNSIIKELKSIKNKKNKTIIDLGCGIGNSFKYIQGFKEIMVVDYSNILLKKARKKANGNFKFKNQNILNLNLNNKKFDYILSIMSLFPQNYNDFNIMVENIKKLMKKNTIFYLVVPSIESATLYFQIKLKNLFNEKELNINEIMKIINNEIKLRNYSPFGYFKTTDNIIQKYWLKEELELRLEHELGLKIDFIKKFELNWTNQFKYKEDQSEKKLWYWFLKIKQK